MLRVRTSGSTAPPTAGRISVEEQCRRRGSSSLRAAVCCRRGSGSGRARAAVDEMLDLLRDYLDVASEMSYGEGRRAARELGDCIRQLAEVSIVVGVRDKHMLLSPADQANRPPGTASRSNSSARTKSNFRLRTEHRSPGRARPGQTRPAPERHRTPRPGKCPGTGSQAATKGAVDVAVRWRRARCTGDGSAQGPGPGARHHACARASCAGLPTACGRGRLLEQTPGLTRSSRVAPRRTWSEGLEPCVQEAEFVAFWVGQNVPTLGASLADVGWPGAESEQPLQFGVLVAVDGVDVDMQSELPGPRIAARAEDEGWLRTAEANVGRPDLDAAVVLPAEFDVAEDLAPEYGEPVGVGGVDD
jgi:hypothetical protein